MGKILKNHTFRYYTMICNYLIIIICIIKIIYPYYIPKYYV